MVGDDVSVPQKVVERNKIMTLAADVFFVNGIAYSILVDCVETDQVHYGKTCCHLYG